MSTTRRADKLGYPYSCRSISSSAYIILYSSNSRSEGRCFWDSLQAKDKKVTAAKEVKEKFKERFKTSKNRWFFIKLRLILFRICSKMFNVLEMAPNKERIDLFNYRFNDKYKIGIQEFLDYSFKKTGPVENTRCPSQFLYN